MSTHNLSSESSHTRNLRTVDTSPGLNRPDPELPQEYDVQVEDDNRSALRHDATTRDSQGLAPPTGEEVPHPELGTPYLHEGASSWAQGRWDMIQAEFVDDPRKSVADAHQLVGELMQRIVDAFAKQRNELERQWSSGQEVSTEDLRLCLQGYRSFFGRLLPAVPSNEQGHE